MTRRWFGLVLGLPLVSGCLFDPPGEEVFTPPAVYREWFAQTERCAVLHAPFDRITWIAADLVGLAGYRQGNRIWIDRDWLDSRYAVSHESLHYILDGDGDHQRPEWDQCRAIQVTYEAP